MKRMMIKIDIVVPKYFNDGTEINRNLIQYLQDIIIGQFGGLSVTDNMTGYWLSKGHIYNDKNMVFSVVTETIPEDFIKFVKEYIKYELKQKDVFIVKSEVTLL
jgi:hypothetical protein